MACQPVSCWIGCRLKSFAELDLLGADPINTSGQGGSQGGEALQYLYHSPHPLAEATSTTTLACTNNWRNHDDPKRARRSVGVTRTMLI